MYQFKEHFIVWQLVKGEKLQINKLHMKSFKIVHVSVCIRNIKSETFAKIGHL